MDLAETSFSIVDRPLGPCDSSSVGGQRARERQSALVWLPCDLASIPDSEPKWLVILRGKAALLGEPHNTKAASSDASGMDRPLAASSKSRGPVWFCRAACRSRTIQQPKKTSRDRGVGTGSMSWLEEHCVPIRMEQVVYLRTTLEDNRQTNIELQKGYSMSNPETNVMSSSPAEPEAPVYETF
ncbi:hypothetical protein N658DRAFT_361322 [Parathielavia hyrcaniae]|uniref:Uncharacterized protein n=1 Tax=Parathielavia hyrcaniae TaxID=113614 RepID=A0AAN6PSW7_9PEZI|nr:hypothetical protein N658DRAFT_361322 [Parathielavia hyrcaniae]